VHALGDQFEITPGGDLPPLRLFLIGHEKAFTVQPGPFDDVAYPIEENRGYDCRGGLWSPGYFRFMLGPDTPGTLIASTESWEMIGALQPEQALQAEYLRRRRLLDTASRVHVDDALASELVLAADQFLITPAGRAE